MLSREHEVEKTSERPDVTLVGVEWAASGLGGTPLLQPSVSRNELVLVLIHSHVKVYHS